MEQFKRVIACDLFETLIRSGYAGVKYYELLEQHSYGSNPDYISATIRGQLMNFHPRHQEMSGNRMWHDEPSDEVGIDDEYMRLVTERLDYSFDGDPNSHNTNQSRLNYVTREEIVKCWKAENNALEWIEGARETLESLENNETRLVLATNITAVGMWATCSKLPELSDIFKKIYWSCNLPVAKPDPYVWKCIEKEFIADEYWMIGNDFLIDLVMPAALGWKTILVGNDGVKITAVPKIISPTKAGAL